MSSNKTYSRRAGRPALQNKLTKPDNQLTKDELAKLTCEMLRFKCGKLGINGLGKKSELVNKLYEHFHPKTAPSAPNPTADATDLPPPPPEIIREENDDIVIDDNLRQTTESADTFPYGDDNAAATAAATVSETRKRPRDVTPPPQEREDVRTRLDLNDIITRAVNSSLATAVSSAVADAMKPVLEEMEVHRQNSRLQEAENRALRSHLKNSQGGTGTVINSSSSPPHSSSSNNTAASSSTAAPQVHFTVDASADKSVNAADVTPVVHPPPLCKKNPFALPGLLKKDLLAIEQGDYVDFDRIKPKRLDQRKREEEGEDGFGLAMTTYYDSELGEETLRLKKVSSNKVETFAEWSECWNKFLSARLHYKPEEQAVLMAYQRKITSFARKFKFSAVYDYDKDFRKTIAAERSVHKDFKSAKWECQHDDLRNEHLTIDQLLTPKSCFKCKEKGHIATNCPRKNISGGNRQRQQQDQQTYQPRFQPQGPPMPPPPPPPPQPPQPFQPFQSFHQFQTPFYHQPGPVGPPQPGPRPQQNYGGKPKTCNTYNHQGSCYRGPTCIYPHLCNRCGFPHPGKYCDKDTTTSFFPPTSGYQPRY